MPLALGPQLQCLKLLNTSIRVPKRKRSMHRTYLQSVGGHTGMRGAASNKSQRPQLLLLMISLHSLSDLPSHVGVKESLPQILAGQVTRASQKNDTSVTRYSADSDNVQAQCHQECSSYQISCHLEWGEIYALPRMQRNCKTEDFFLPVTVAGEKERKTTSHRNSAMISYKRDSSTEQERALALES